MRSILLQFPEVTQVVSQTGRPDDGTDPNSFNNIDFNVELRPTGEWKQAYNKEELIQQMNHALARYPGISFNFSQNIQDNVEEAMSGVKGENSLKLFGDELELLANTANRIQDVMAKVPGVADLGVLKETGQSNLVISIDRTAAARYGVMAADVDTAVQAAIGSAAVTQILEGDRRFDFVVRYKPEFRQDPEAMKNILLPTADGGRVPLGQIAGQIPSNISLSTGTGKTSVIPVWLLALAQNPALPKRLVYVVDRRSVVDQATKVVEQLVERLPSVTELTSYLRGLSLEGEAITGREHSSW